MPPDCPVSALLCSSLSPMGGLKPVSTQDVAVDRVSATETSEQQARLENNQTSLILVQWLTVLALQGLSCTQAQLVCTTQTI